jgi:hypothetical protein
MWLDVEHVIRLDGLLIVAMPPPHPLVRSLDSDG